MKGSSESPGCAIERLMSDRAMQQPEKKQSAIKSLEERGRKLKARHSLAGEGGKAWTELLKDFKQLE